MQPCEKRTKAKTSDNVGSCSACKIYCLAAGLSHELPQRRMRSLSSACILSGSERTFLTEFLKPAIQYFARLSTYGLRMLEAARDCPAPLNDNTFHNQWMITHSWVCSIVQPRMMFCSGACIKGGFMRISGMVEGIHQPGFQTHCLCGWTGRITLLPTPPDHSQFEVSAEMQPRTTNSSKAVGTWAKELYAALSFCGGRLPLPSSHQISTCRAVTRAV